VADDLTGACDAAVAFATHGHRATVLLDLSHPEFHEGAVAVNTDSRNLDGCDMRYLARAFESARPRFLFKKIDSLLRGNTAAEVAAALAAFGRETAVITPAFPGTGRVVKAGCLRVVGREDFVPIDLAACFGPHGLAPHVAGDVASDRDLDAIVAGHLADSHRILWVGSGGLAAALARAVARPLAQSETPRPCGPVLFVIGSDHPVTLEQQRHLLLARPDSKILPFACAGMTQDLARRRAATGAVFLSGGDTAAAVCRAIGARAIELEREIVTGIPLGRLSGGIFDGVPVVTKSGAFGRPDALIQVAEYFSCH
jgi:uncharacterized protein YgbK (DUF1537 family)